MYNISPCKGCEDRQIACHDKCAKFAQWKAEFQRLQAAEKEYKKRRREDFLRSEECKDAQRAYTNSKTRQRRGDNHGR